MQMSTRGLEAIIGESAVLSLEIGGKDVSVALGYSLAFCILPTM